MTGSPAPESCTSERTMPAMLSKVRLRERKIAEVEGVQRELGDRYRCLKKMRTMRSGWG